MMALFVQLDANYPDHPKLIAAGLDGAGLHAFAMCTAKRLESDGWVHRALLHRMGATDDLIAKLVKLRLFEVREDEVRPWGWLDRNPSQGAIDAIRATKADAAKAGNHKRWGHKGSVDKCVKCNPSVQVVAGCDSDRSQAESHCGPLGSPYTETETETYTETETETATPTKSQDYSQPAEPEPPPTVVESAAAADVEQESRRALALWGQAEATRAGATNPGGYATKARRTAVDDGTADKLASLVAQGHTAETAVAELTPLDPLGADLPRPSRDPGPDITGMYTAAEARRQETLAEQPPPGDHMAGLRAARAARRRAAS